MALKFSFVFCNFVFVFSSVQVSLKQLGEFKQLLSNNFLKITNLKMLCIKKLSMSMELVLKFESSVLSVHLFVYKCINNQLVIFDNTFLIICL